MCSVDSHSQFEIHLPISHTVADWISYKCLAPCSKHFRFSFMFQTLQLNQPYVQLRSAYPSLSVSDFSNFCFFLTLWAFSFSAGFASRLKCSGLFRFRLQNLVSGESALFHLVHFRHPSTWAPRGTVSMTVQTATPVLPMMTMTMLVTTPSPKRDDSSNSHFWRKRYDDCHSHWYSMRYHWGSAPCSERMACTGLVGTG